MSTYKIVEANKHYPQLDGLRGIAIIMVVFYHFFPHCAICNLGWTGVDLFFVLSGFLISSRLFPFLDDKKILQKFYWNRFLRIVPLYFSFLILFFLCWFLFTSKNTIILNSFYTNHWWQFFLFIQNWVYVYNTTSGSIHLIHLWSVALEEQFYLIFPIFVFYIKDIKKLLILAISILSSLLLLRCFIFYFTKTDVSLLHQYSFIRIDSFIGGFIIYALLEKGIIPLKNLKTNFLIIAAIFILVFWVILNKSPKQSIAFYSTFGYLAIAIIYVFFLFIVLVSDNKIINKITNFYFIKYIGKISYGIYIFHYPIYIFGFTFLNRCFTKMDVFISPIFLEYINAFASIIATLIISILSYKYFELKFLSWKIKKYH